MATVTETASEALAAAVEQHRLDSSETDARLLEALVEAAQAGMSRGELAEAVGMGRSWFSHHFSALLDERVSRPRSGPPPSRRNPT